MSLETRMTKILSAMAEARSFFGIRKWESYLTYDSHSRTLACV